MRLICLLTKNFFCIVAEVTKFLNPIFTSIIINRESFFRNSAHQSGFFQLGKFQSIRQRKEAFCKEKEKLKMRLTSLLQDKMIRHSFAFYPIQYLTKKKIQIAKIKHIQKKVYEKYD